MSVCVGVLVEVVSLYISFAWASALLVPGVSGNARALSCGDGQQVMHPRFFCAEAHILHQLLCRAGITGCGWFAIVQRMDEQNIGRQQGLHIGQLIKQELESQERTVSWFARKLYCDRSNIYKIFKRPTIDTELLLRISVILKHDFFADYQERISAQEGMPPSNLSE